MLAFTFHKSLPKHARLFGEILMFFLCFSSMCLTVKTRFLGHWKLKNTKILQMAFWSEGAPLSTSSSFIPLYAFLTCTSCKKKLSISWTAEVKAGELESFLRYCMFSFFFPTYTLFGPLHSGCWRRLCCAFILPTLFCMLDMVWACMNGSLKFPPSEVVIKPAWGLNNARV